ncbi:ATP-binding protein [Paenibacillus sp. V4I3]|uniref:ATP-binding protein n=1 Tax=Paenibacillus sp. V4I3 TaxID=3042305 RepID=UPI0027D8E16C|nr:ATP-binding protein [Paenibacillus sp. V4I3]
MIRSGNYSEFSKKIDLFRQSDQNVLYVIGESGVGKTSAALEYINKNGRNNEVLYSVLALPPTLKNFGVELLLKLNISFQKHMHTDQILERVAMALKTHGIKLLLLDDFEKALVSHEGELEKIVMFINILSKITDVKIVLFGLPEIHKLSGRRNEVYEFEQSGIAIS